jgi:hypothetical protein
VTLVQRKTIPKDWKENPMIQIALSDYKETLIKNNFDILVDENLDFDIMFANGYRYIQLNTNLN